MFEKVSVRRALVALLLCVVSFAAPAWGQDALKKGGSVPITFLPPPLEDATYSVGIYEVKTGKLARRLCEAAGQDTFKVGLNGLITSWDGKDDNGKGLPPGKYAARGYAVGPMEVEGVDVLGNDWAGDDERLRIAHVEAIVLVPEDQGVVIAGRAPFDESQVARYGGEGTKFIWESDHPSPKAEQAAYSLELPKGAKFVYTKNVSRTGGFRLTTGEQGMPRAADGSPMHEPPGSGQNGTTWKIEEGVLSQYSSTGERLRSLAPTDGEPVPVAVASSPDAERIYLLEETKSWQRVRGLSPAETKQENGKTVSTWQTVFERSIRAPDPALGLEDMASAKGGSPAVEIFLEENPLTGKRPHAKFSATLDEKGSYLATADGLRLRQISQRAHLRAVRLSKDKEGGALSFFQTDGAAWDQFAVRGARKVMEFDAGEFEIDAAGEKPNAEKAPEPDL